MLSKMKITAVVGIIGLVLAVGAYKNLSAQTRETYPENPNPYASSPRDSYYQENNTPLIEALPNTPNTGRPPLDNRDVRDSRNVQDPRDLRDMRDPRDLRDPRDVRDIRDVQDPRSSQGFSPVAPIGRDTNSRPVKANNDSFTQILNGNFRVTLDTGMGLLPIDQVIRMEFHEQYVMIFDFRNSGRLVPVSQIRQLTWEPI